MLFRLPGGWHDHENMEELRCMASGRNLGEVDGASSLPCTGATGLAEKAADRAEFPGCQDGDDNFLATVEAVAGEVYLLLVTNFLSPGGFLLEFSGDALPGGAPAPCHDAGEEGLPVLNGIQDVALTVGTLFPNPSGTSVTALVESGTACDGLAEIVDMQGKVLKARKVSMATGLHPLTVPVHDLDKGFYLLKIRLCDNLYVGKFIKM